MFDLQKQVNTFAAMFLLLRKENLQKTVRKELLKNLSVKRFRTVFILVMQITIVMDLFLKESIMLRYVMNWMI